jgi:hypothetical protein
MEKMDKRLTDDNKFIAGELGDTIHQKRVKMKIWPARWFTGVVVWRRRFTMLVCNRFIHWLERQCGGVAGTRVQLGRQHW